MDTKINLTLNLVNGILNYLGTKPYAEVFALVQEIQSQALPQLPTPDPAQAPVVTADAV